MPKLKPELLEACWHDVKVARKGFRDDLQKVMEESLGFYYGQQWQSSEKDTGLRHVVVNYSAANIEIKWASLTFRPPQFSVKPLIQTDPLTPFKLSSFLNRNFINGGGWAACQGALYDCLIFGTGAVMTGWNSGELRPVKMSDEEAQEAGEYEQSLEEGREVFGKIGAAQVVPQVTEMEMEIVGEGPKVLHVPIEDIIMDPRVKWHNWQDARYVGRVYVKSVDELKRNKALKNTKKLQGVATLRNTENEFNGDMALQKLPEDSKKPYVLLVEMWYKGLYLENGWTDEDGVKYPAGSYPMRILWSSSMPDDPLLVECSPYKFEDIRGVWQYPFDFIHNRRDPKSFYGIGDIQIQKEQQKELNRSRSQKITRGEQLGNVKWWAKKGSVPPSQRSRLESMQNGILIEGNGDVPPSPILKPGLDAEIEQNGLDAIDDMTVAVGVDEASRGVRSPTRQTATEVQITAEKSAPRGSKSQTEFETFVSAVGNKILQVCKQFEHTGDTVPVSVPKQLQQQPDQGDVAYLEIAEDDLVLANVEVETGSTRQLDQNAKMNALTQILQLGASLNVLGSAQNPINGEINTRYFLEQLVNVSDAGDPQQAFDVSAYQQAAQQLQQQAMAQQQAQMGAPQPGMDPNAPPQDPSGGGVAPPGQPGDQEDIQALLSTLSQGGQNAG